MGWKTKVVTSYCRLQGGKGIGKWWEEKIGQAEEARRPRCGEEEETPEHVVFWYMGIKRVKEIRKRREWFSLRWDRWEALASKRWVRMEDTGRVDDEGKVVFERVGSDGGAFRKCPFEEVYLEEFTSVYGMWGRRPGGGYIHICIYNLVGCI